MSSGTKRGGSKGGVRGVVSSAARATPPPPSPPRPPHNDGIPHEAHGCDGCDAKVTRVAREIPYTIKTREDTLAREEHDGAVIGAHQCTTQLHVSVCRGRLKRTGEGVGGCGQTTGAAAVATHRCTACAVTNARGATLTRDVKMSSNLAPLKEHETCSDWSAPRSRVCVVLMLRPERPGASVPKPTERFTRDLACDCQMRRRFVMRSCPRSAWREGGRRVTATAAAPRALAPPTHRPCCPWSPRRCRVSR